MRELFVYYRVHIGSESIATMIVDQFQANLKQHIPQIAARLLRRPPVPGEAQTWMETYAMASGGITPAHQRAIEDAALALAPHLDGPRHTEVFFPVERA